MRTITGLQQGSLYHPAKLIVVLLWLTNCLFSPPAYGYEQENELQDIIASISGEEAAGLLGAYIRYPSITGNEKPAGEFFTQLCRDRGLNVMVFTDSDDCFNFAASLYPLPSEKPNIILLHHIDVVSEGDMSGWKEPAFSGAITQDTVWGRGAIDMKGMAIMQLLAVSAFAQMAKESDLPVNVTLLGVSGEETYGTRGSRIICDSFLYILDPVVVLGEGGIGSKNIISGSPEQPVFCVSASDKRALWTRLQIICPTSGHGSVPPPEYANKLMINALGNLTNLKPRIHFNGQTRDMFRTYGSMEKRLTGCVLRHPVFFKPLICIKLRKDPLLLATVTNTITITHFEGQDNDINQIPQEISVALDCRLIPETSTDEFLEFLEKKLDTKELEISIIKETQFASPTIPEAYYFLLEEAIVETFPGAGVMTILFPATTDNNYFRNRGIPVYGLFPAIMDQELLKTVHNYNERIPVDCLVRGTEIYMRFLAKLLTNTQDSPHIVAKDHSGFPGR